MPRHRTPGADDLLDVFERLLAAYGPRHWWPGDGSFEIIAGAILTQNTAWSNVSKALGDMREAGVWSMAAVDETPQEQLAALVRPSGYFNQKARKLKVFAAFVADEFEGDLDGLLALPADDLRGRLLALWGIGEETADDIVLYAAGKPSFVIDTYTRRIVDRLGWRVAGNGYGDYQRLFTERLPRDAALYNEFHALLDAHGHRTCRPKPLCGGCALLEVCATGAKLARRGGR